MPLVQTKTRKEIALFPVEGYFCWMKKNSLLADAFSTLKIYDSAVFWLLWLLEKSAGGVTVAPLRVRSPAYLSYAFKILFDSLLFNLNFLSLARSGIL